MLRVGTNFKPRYHLDFLHIVAMFNVAYQFILEVVILIQCLQGLYSCACSNRDSKMDTPHRSGKNQQFGLS